MNTPSQLTKELIDRAKNLKKFTVLRHFDEIPVGVVKFDIKHTTGKLAEIYVYALHQQEAEQLVDEWFNDDTTA